MTMMVALIIIVLEFERVKLLMIKMADNSNDSRDEVKSWEILLRIIRKTMKEKWRRALSLWVRKRER